MKYIKDHFLILCVLCSAVIVTFIGMAGRNGRYASYQDAEGDWQPAVTYVLRGIADGVYPWSDTLEESAELLNYEEPEELAAADIQETAAADREHVQNEIIDTKAGISEEDSVPPAEELQKEEMEMMPPQDYRPEEAEASDTQEDIPEDAESKADSIENAEGGEPDPEPAVSAESPDPIDEDPVSAMPPVPLDPTKPYTCFSNALFIGDSRTVGMQSYGGLDEDVEFYCATSMTVFKLFQKPKAFAHDLEGKRCTLEEALSERQFDHIFIMLGLNELGTGNTSYFIDAYEDALVRIRALQPNAKIYVQGIMRVAGSKSRSDRTFRNEVVNERNQGLQELCGRMGLTYLEINDALCDENGDLCEEYTSDQVHLKAKYYTLWVDYLRENAVP